jgi:inner membrane protein
MADPLAILAALGPAWSWVIAGLVLAGAEIVVPGVFLIWFGLAAVATGLATALIPIPLQGQTAVVLVGLATRLHRRAGRHDATLNRADRGLIGREAVLPEPIRQGAGRLRFDDTLWRIEGPDLPAGARVRVIGLAGTVLRVEAV